MARTRKSKETEVIQNDVEVTQVIEETSDSIVETKEETPVDEVIENQTDTEVVEVKDKEPVEKEQLIEEVVDQVQGTEDSEEEEKPVEDPQTEGLQQGEAYVVKCNKFLPDRASKFEVRLHNGTKGYARLLRASKEKAYFKAVQINKAHGITSKLVIID